MVVARLHLIIIAVVAGGALWIEQAHRIKIESPIAAEVAGHAACPANESVPFSADCMAFIQGGVASEVSRRVNEVDAASVESPEQP
jgi:hypothetical protein